MKYKNVPSGQVSCTKRQLWYGIPLSLSGGIIFNAMKEIELTKGYKTQVDDEDYDYLMQWKWHVAIQKKFNVYAKRTTPHVGGKQKTVKMHREIMKVPDNLDIDHIDGNGLNNQKSNMRICNQSQNTQNMVKHRKTASKYLGVHKDKTRQGKPRWVFRIKNGGVNVKRSFLTEYEAALGRDRYVLDNNLEFPKLNILTRPKIYDNGNNPSKIS